MLKVFQLRGARYILGIGVREIGGYLNLSRTKISNIENQDIDHNLNITSEQNDLLLRLFNDKGIEFPDSSRMRLKNQSDLHDNSISRFQLRGGRTILGLSQKTLADALNLKKSDLYYLENLENSFLITDNAKSADANSIELFFRHKGIYLYNNYIISINPLDSSCPDTVG